MLNGLDLFSGIGGLSLALKPWVRTVAYCEIDPYCVSVLQKRMGAELYPGNIFDDVRSLRRGHISEPVDIVFGGFPCQDISLAGKRAGLDGKRSGLYREVIRIVDECRPTFVFLENVAAIRSHAWRVVEDLAGLGFDCRWTNLSAAEVGAPHRRDRWWLLAANPDSFDLWLESGRGRRENGQGSALTVVDGKARDVANTDRQRELQQSGTEPYIGRRFGDGGKPSPGGDWAIEPDVGRVAHGVPARVDRLRALGNAVVPAQARKAFKILSGFEGE